MLSWGGGSAYFVAMARCLFRIGSLASLVLVAATFSAKAAENAAGFYLLGGRGPMAGYMPPQGVYLESDFYFYDGSLGEGREIITGGRIIANVNASMRADFESLSWVTPWEIFGGTFAIGAIVPSGYVTTEAGLEFSGPLLGTIAQSVKNSTTVVGDPILSTTLGWHSGNFYWNLTGLMNTPIGNYHAGQIANLAFHRWAGDISGALTWFDPQIGLDLSVITGLTFNGENPVTQYRTGTEYHLEWASIKSLTKGLSAGMIGYYYRQITDDRGPGARLGAFKGEVAAFGGTIAYDFDVNKFPISTRIKVFREFNVQNRLTGTSGTFTLAFPLYAAK